MNYHPPYTITPFNLQRIAEIVELLTRWSVSGENAS